MSAANPISPKAHGAWLGAGSGAALTAEIIGLIQTYWTHKPLEPALVSLMYTVIPALVAFLGAWLAPLIPSSIESQIAQQSALTLPTLLPSVQVTSSVSGGDSGAVPQWPGSATPSVTATIPTGPGDEQHTQAEATP